MLLYAHKQHMPMTYMTFEHYGGAAKSLQTIAGSCAKEVGRYKRRCVVACHIVTRDLEEPNGQLAYWIRFSRSTMYQYVLHSFMSNIFGLHISVPRGHSIVIKGPSTPVSTFRVPKQTAMTSEYS